MELIVVEGQIEIANMKKQGDEFRKETENKQRN